VNFAHCIDPHTVTEIYFNTILIRMRPTAIDDRWLGLLPGRSIQFRVGCLSKRFKLYMRPSFNILCDRV